MSLNAVELTEWLREAIGLEQAEAAAGPYIPDMPDRLLIITQTGGAGPQLEGMADVPGFQIRARGKQSDYTSAHELGYAADAVLMNAGMTVIGGVAVHAFSRSGGPPFPEPPDDGDRTTFLCNYLARVASSF